MYSKSSAIFDRLESVSAMMRNDSVRRCSYTFVPATSFKSASRSWSFALVSAVIYAHVSWTHPLERTEQTYSSLRYDVVWVTFAKACALEQVHYVSLAGTLLVQAVFVLLETDCASENDFLPAGGETIVGIIENDLD